ncbi:MAG: ATP cone domain-containing protein [Candidatus Wallbacteria bacterium]|nr:ATP cone domain-containing protein [Candidatus Wallbacteria bacterium]
MKIKEVLHSDGRTELFDIHKTEKVLWGVIKQIKGFNREKFLQDVMPFIVARYQGFAYSNITTRQINELIIDALEEGGHDATLEAYLVFTAQKSLVKSKRLSAWINLGVPYQVIFDTAVICGINNCLTLDHLAEIGKDPSHIKHLMQTFESNYKMQLSMAAHKVKERISEGARVIIVAGPSSSNKTSTTLWLTRLLKEEHGLDINLYPLHVDDYFKNRDEFPIDKFGDPDYESPDALKIGLIDQHIRGLVDGREIEKPIYDFKTSSQVGTEKVKISSDSIVLIDCLHGLTPEITASTPDELKIKVYIECMPILLYDEKYKNPSEFRNLFSRWTDWRIMRRSVRDDQSRGTNPYQTFGHWHYVRKWELRSLIPYLIDVDITINSYNPAEIYYFRAYLWDKLDKIIEGLKAENRPDGVTRATRVKKLLEKIPPFSDTSIIPLDSPLLEFINPKAQKIL